MSGIGRLINRAVFRLCALLVLAALVALLAGTTLVHAQSNSPAQAPSNLTAEVDSCGVNLAWDAPTEDAGSVTGYNLLRTPAGGTATTLNTGAASSTDTAYSDTSATRAETYTYLVKALRGDVASDDSNEVEVALPAAPTPTAVEVESVPIVVTSTTTDYFVLYVTHELDDETTVEYPVLVALGEAGTTTLSENVAALPKERYRVEKYQVSSPADVDGDCIDDITELNQPRALNPVNPGSIDAGDGAVILPDSRAFEALVKNHSDHAIRPLHAKFVVDGARGEREVDRPSVYFMSREYSRHADFTEEVLGISKPSAVVRAEIGYLPDLTSPSGTEGVFVFSPSDYGYPFHVLERVYTLLAASMPFLNDNLVFWVTDNSIPKYRSKLALIEDSRIPLVFDQDIIGYTDFLAFNPAVGYGRLKALDPDETPHSRDIVLYGALPNELPRVAGVISTVPQTPLSHINLRAVQNGIPNAFIRDADDNSEITDLTGSYVRYEVTDDGWSLRAATKAEVDSHYESSRPASTQTPERDLSATAITPLGQIGFDDWDSFGVKAANLAVMGTLDFPDGTVPDGFAIPFYFYDEFMKANELYDDVRGMLADEDFQTDYEEQEDQLKDLRKAIKKADSPQWIIDALTEMHETYPEGQSLRYRSSTNNEDLPGFNGAGLYDSKTQHSDETEEDGIDKSLKQVFAGLWTFRAFTEREFHRIDHLSAAMGVLVHPNFSDELANGVAVSFDSTADRSDVSAFDRYYVNTQVGEDLVTNPEAHSVPEEILVSRDSDDYSIVGTSNLVERGELLLSEAQLLQLRNHLKVIHDHFEELYKPACDELFAMEIEFKITSDNVLSIKQARPWVFGPVDAPGKPTISSGEVTTSSVTFSWKAPGSTVAGYQIMRQDRAIHDMDEYPVYVDNTCSRETTFTDTDVEAGKSYIYRIKARNSGGLSEQSNFYYADLSAPGRGSLVGFFDNAPISHDGESDFEVWIRFNRPITASSKKFPQAFETENGSVKATNRMEGRSDFWVLSVEPTGVEDVTLTLLGNRPCGEGGVPCAKPLEGKGRIPLSNSPTITIPGPDPIMVATPALLTVSLTSRPTSHNGTDTFTFEMSFSEEPKPDFSYKTLQDHAFTVTGGSVKKAGRMNRPSNISWQITIQPDGNGNVIAVLPVTTDCEAAGAVCTGDGRKLSSGLSVVISGTVQNSSATGVPTISGTAQVGQLLTAGTTGITDTDGLNNVSYSYHWMRSDGTTDTDITGATGSTYTLVSEDQGKAIKVRVSFTDDVDNAETLTSLATVAVAARPNTPATGSPTISGTVQEGETLTADTSGISDADGLDNVVFSYQWVRSDGTTDTDITGATGSTYTLVSADQGKTVKVRVSFTDDASNSETRTSASTASVAARPNTPATGTPTISGTAGVGETLTVDTSGISDADGLDNVSLQLPVGEERRYDRHRHYGGHGVDVHAGAGGPGQDGQGPGQLHRRRG